MSVHSQPSASYPAAAPAPTSGPPAAPGAAPGAAPAPGPLADRTGTAPAFPRHVVTAVLVAHDGARWLPDALAGLTGQERPVQYIVAADTGSADDSAQLLADALGPDRVLHLARRSGFGTAVDEAVRTAPVPGPDQLPYLKRPSSWDPATRTWRDDTYDMPELPHGEPVQWLWLLHDDCAPAPDALAELLKVADASPRTAIVGPKLRSWYDGRQLLEVGVSIARSGRRWTGLERREQDQGQHDQVRPVLAVSTAGMLIRRDVWEQLGGFDPRLPLMRDDIDLCWRAQAAGHQVLIAPDAVLRHAEASARERRPIDCVGRSVADPHKVDKAGAVYTLLANTRGALLPYVLLRIVLSTLLRTLAYLVGKVPRQALDEITGLFSTLLRPEKILAARRTRGKPQVEAAELRPLFPPPGATVRATVEQVASNVGGRSEPELSAGGRHGAVESGPGDDDADFLEVDQFARLKRIARKPGPMLFAVLLLVSFVACRGLIGGGALAGGALLPAPSDVTDLWARYTDGWHPVGTGGTQTAPPYLAVLAALSTVFLGSTGFTLTLLLVCSVPLAGITAYFASRPLVESRLLRAWGAVAYAFLPAATGALAAGRIGTAALAVLLPLLARAAAAAGGFTRSRPSWRAVWAYALLLTFTTAFTPVVWPLALLLGLGVLAFRFYETRTEQLTAYGLRLLAVLATPLLVLAPWSLGLLAHPGRFLDEAGLDPGTGSGTALELLSLSPGGPKAGGSLLLLGFVLAALGALLRGERQTAIRTAWVVALAGLLFAAISNGSGWAGPATLVYGLGLLSAAVVGAEGARERVAAQSFGWRQPAALLVAVASAAAPLLAALSWMAGGANGPVERRDPVQVPAFVAEEATDPDQARTLVLDGDQARVDYVLVRGRGARLGDGELAAEAGSDPRLDAVVANLVAGSGADQSSQLSGYAVGYVLIREGAPRPLVKVLETTPGLTRLSQEDGTTLLRVDQRVSRVAILPAPDGDRPAAAASAAPVPVGAGPVEAHTDIPAGPAGRVLRVADRAAPGWQATLDGKPLKAVKVDDWAQGFELPAEGGRLDLTYETPLTHTAWVWTQALFAVVLLVLALPGRRREIDDDLPEAEAAAQAAAALRAQEISGDGRRARRLRAAAEAAEAAATPTAGPSGAAVPDAWPTGPTGPGEPGQVPAAAGDTGAAPTPPMPDVLPHSAHAPGEAGQATALPAAAIPEQARPVGSGQAPEAAAGYPAPAGAVPAPPTAPPAAGDPYAEAPAEAPPAGGQTYDDWPGTQQPYPAAPADYATYQGDPYQAGAYPSGSYPSASYPQGRYTGDPAATGPYQDGQYAGGQYGDGQYQDSQYGEGQYAQAQYPDGSYPEDPYAAARYPEDPYPAQPYQPGGPHYSDGTAAAAPHGDYPSPGDTTYGGGDSEAHRDGSEHQR